MYACPNCGGGLRFDIPSQKLKCDYCATLTDPYDISRDKDADMQTDEYGVTLFTCPQCGGEVVTTDESITGFCTFCGASTMLDARMKNEKRPAKIITFKKTKEDCKEIYKKTAGRAFFAPKELKDPEYLEKFRGIYIPYWVYDIEYSKDVAFSGTRQTATVTHYITEYYRLQSNLDAEYTGISYDASASFDDHISESIAPFNTANMQDFTPSFLCGFYADTADTDKNLYRDDAVSAAQTDVSNNILKNNTFTSYNIGDIAKSLAGAERINNEEDDPVIGLFPVWFLSYRTPNNRVAYAVVNAESGEISADLPVSVGKYTLFSLLIAIPIFGLLAFLFTMTPKITLLITAAIAVISLIAYGREISEIKKRHMKYDDKGFYAKYGPKADEEEIKKVAPGRGAIGAVIGLIIIVAVLIINPVDDYWYYGAAIAAIIGVFITITGIIRRFNILSTRPLPKFLNRKGGDDSAKD